jgi:hypothetical protein
LRLGTKSYDKKKSKGSKFSSPLAPLGIKRLNCRWEQGDLNLMLDFSFCHNFYLIALNKNAKTFLIFNIFDIYVVKTFQWYKEYLI